MTALIVVLFIILLLALFDWIRYKIRRKKYLIGIPGPSYIPLFGNLFEFKSVEDSQKVGFKFILTYGDIFVVYLSPFMEFLCVTNTKLIEKILTSPKFLTKAQDYNLLQKWLGDGLITSTGEKWRKNRKFLTPAFHFNNLPQFIDTFNEAGDILIDKLKKKLNNSPIEIFPLVTLCTLDIICKAIMGISINAQTSKHSEYVESVNYMKNTLYRRLLSVWKVIDWLYPLSIDYWKEKKALKILFSTTDRVINERRNYLLKKPKNDNKNCTTFLDMLLHGTIDGRPLTNEEIREQAETFMFAGHDTTSAALSYTLLALSYWQNVQDKIVEEIKIVIDADKNIQPTYQNLLDLKYLDVVMKECLRMAPAVPVIGRTVTEDTELDGVLLPKGLRILIPIIFVHRNYSKVPNCDLFLDDRFADKNWNGDDPFSYIPFSGGHRNCIGQKFAWLELKALLVKLLVNFKFSTIPNRFYFKLIPDIVLKPADGIPLNLKLRE